MNLSLLCGTEFLCYSHNAIILYTVPCQPYAGFISFHWIREGGEFLHIPFHSCLLDTLKKRNTIGKWGGYGDKKRNIPFITFPRGKFPFCSYSFFLKVNLYPATSLSGTQEQCLNASGCSRMLLGAAR
jgi:hypothetical protein